MVGAAYVIKIGNMRRFVRINYYQIPCESRTVGRSDRQLALTLNAIRTTSHMHATTRHLFSRKSCHMYIKTLGLKLAVTVCLPSINSFYGSR